MANILGIISGAMLSAAFVFPKPSCYVAALASATAVILLRFLF